MVIQRLEMCREMVKMAIQFVMVVAEAVVVVMHQNPALPATNSALTAATPVPFVGFLP
ncbi:hypothetical protein TIFTF001_006891 [Ficus carica]|uniref:Uncharacterized protein n=1 Tax=Ficus carica TaxID=3494 RepID=A0AA88D0A4_FICCA|nr:hypothetical protein TIFTF001_006891 [Ficus carica]